MKTHEVRLHPVYSGEEAGDGIPVEEEDTYYDFPTENNTEGS